MQLSEIQQLAERLVRGDVSLPDFVDELTRPATADVGEAQVDLDRQRRCGFPEVVFGQGKTVTALEKIFHALLDEAMPVLCTRVDAEKAAALVKRFPTGHYNAVGRTFRVASEAAEAATGDEDRGLVAIVTAGTSDLPVGEEARETADWMGARVLMIQDIGVAGPQRLQARLPEIRQADAIVVIAGMEGALPSVVGGHVDCPVVAVPTSVGYGTSFGGLTALLGMLNSCAANVTVVNIDAGFKGAYVASLIARGAARGRNADLES